MTTDSFLIRRRLVASAAVVAVVAMGTLSACSGQKSTETPTTPTTTTTTTTTTAPSASPTEKGLNPGSGNKFTPSVKAPGPKTALPGNVVTGN